MNLKGYVSSTSFYIFLIITIVLIYILCISNIVAYANILSNDAVTFNSTWAKILIALNAFLILISTIILGIMIWKFYKGPENLSTIFGFGNRGGSPQPSMFHNSGVDIPTLKQLATENGIDFAAIADVNSCSDGSNILMCPSGKGAKAKDYYLNQLYNQVNSRIDLEANNLFL